MWLDFLEVLYFFPGWLCHFKGPFKPVWCEIQRSKILLVRSWQLTNRTLSDISCHSWLSNTSIVLFPASIYNMIQIHSGETSQSRDFFWSVSVRPHALKLALLTFKNLWEIDHVAWNKHWCQKMKALHLTPTHKKLMVCLYHVIAAPK